ncbi:MAG: hypothetical protein UV56_C0004G0005 [Candidatus Woesebacteria bacterium GW2011_GWC1_43_10b]|uniref:DUF4446 domain-containing protein n=2 Tax=Candidatus Woeseibacteriota TaxID=1752722 RepID=A0A0G1GFJ1_9BACT|nr:MAG: hypothetical protein UV56_C0004G0005 [Candidatus Woesebacteria bacterium GW2011_GWC1_43_10b]KKT33691.1 MAG: hypothetical protein UW21_C0009G0004 [Candidatus Woesebacteria bacterium GW2011_GWB1_44_11b]
MSSQLQVVVFVVFGGWLLVLSGVFYLMFAHYRRLVGGGEPGNLKKVLDRLLDAGESNKKEIAGLFRQVKNIEERGLYNIQKVGIVRFNPFNDTGGNQSFSLAVTDGHDTGFIFTVLHARERSRIYLKSIKEGKSDSELSLEEKKALGVALKG